MKPYYESDLGRLYHENNEEVMAGLKEKFDLCLTDPPYGIKEGDKKNRSRGKLTQATVFDVPEYDVKIPDKAEFEAFISISKNQMIFGGNYFIEYLKNSPCWIVWDKKNSGDFADAELIYTSFETAVRIIEWKWNGFQQQNMRHKEKRVYPGQKPLGLIEILLSRYNPEKGSVIDPYCGSGTTPTACEVLNMPWVAIDKAEKACEIAAKRIEAAASQMSF